MLKGGAKDGEAAFAICHMHAACMLLRVFSVAMQALQQYFRLPIAAVCVVPATFYAVSEFGYLAGICISSDSPVPRMVSPPSSHVGRESLRR